jgi:hypothetical protein
MPSTNITIVLLSCWKLSHINWDSSKALLGWWYWAAVLRTRWEILGSQIWEMKLAEYVQHNWYEFDMFSPFCLSQSLMQNRCDLWEQPLAEFTWDCPLLPWHSTLCYNKIWSKLQRRFRVVESSWRYCEVGQAGNAVPTPHISYICCLL